MVTSNEVQYCYEWDSKLNLTNPNFDQELTTMYYDAEAAKKIPFPTDYILAKFANLSYNDSDYTLPVNWKFLTAAKNFCEMNDYFGVSFWNPKLCQIVIAHRGTKLSSPGALITDIKLSLNKVKTKQSESAATFVHLISEKMKKLNMAEGPHFQLSITGHSLGAWLAQMTTFSAKYFKRDGNMFVEDQNYLENLHVHTVVFESPGCKEALSKLVKLFKPRYLYRKFGNYDVLDMTVYLSKLNPINSINKHVGRIYCIPAKTHSITEILDLFDKITHKIQRELVLDFSSGIYSSSKLIFKKILPFSMKEKIVKIPASENNYSLNVFNEHELEFVIDWHWINEIKHDSLNVQQFKIAHGLSEFKVDYDCNTIEGDDVNRIVACIKRLRLCKTVIFNLLKDDVRDTTYFEIFNLEAMHFQESLLQFNNFYLKDRYNLKDFLKSDSTLLHVYLKNPWIECKNFELSILNNVITFYTRFCYQDDGSYEFVHDYFRPQKYFFINWIKLYKLLSLFPKIMACSKDSIKLLIVEAFDAEIEDIEAITYFLQNTTVKVIILTLDTTWTNDNDCTEVHGYGSDISFKDLIEDSQTQLIAQNNFLLYGRRMSLSDIITTHLPFNNELYERIDKAVPVGALVELMLTPESETIVLDCPYNNILSRVLVLDLYREIELGDIFNTTFNNCLFLIHDKNNLYAEDEKFLNDEQRQFIKINNKIDFEKECAENFEKIVYLFNVNSRSIFLDKIFNREFYIPRKILHMNKVCSSIFKNYLNDDLDYYYFYGNNTEFKKLYASLQKDRKHRFVFNKSKERAKHQVKNAIVNASHLLHIEKSQITWLYSRGNMESLQKYIELGIEVEESQLIEDNIIILSGEPGIGKSSTIGNLFLQYNKTHWVFAINLSQAIFDDLSIGIDLNSAAKFIVKSCGIRQQHFIPHLLSYCLQYETNLPIYLMFDGFDEIEEVGNRETFIDLIRFFKNMCQIKILITTRTYRKQQLENGISVFASQYKLLSYETEVVNFFTDIFSCQLKLFKRQLQMEDVACFIATVLHSSETIFGRSISNFVGSIPIQMRMLAELLEPTDILSKYQVTIMDILHLYQKYIDQQYNIYFKRSGFGNTRVNMWLKEFISEKLHKLAIKKIFMLCAENIEEADMEEFNKVGLTQTEITCNNNLNCQFIHDSVRDFFIAQFLKTWLEMPSNGLFDGGCNIKKFIVSEFLLKKESREVRLFLNCHLKTLVISEHRLEMCKNKFEELWTRGYTVFYNEKRWENFLHYGVKQNSRFLIEKFVIKILVEASKVQLFSARNAYSHTPLFLAIERPDILHVLLEYLNTWSYNDLKTVLVATLLIHNISGNRIAKITKHAQDHKNISTILAEISQTSKQIEGFLEACKCNDHEKIFNIFNLLETDSIISNYLIQMANERKETCLHLATSIEIAEKLLKLGANINCQDVHGMTPLNRAIKRGNTDIALTLIKNGAELIPDSAGCTTLMHAAKNNNMKILKVLLDPKNGLNVNIEHHNVFGVNALMIAARYGNQSVVEYLLDRGADISCRHANEMTPIYYAVKGNHTHLIKFFKDRNADINAKDQQGNTPLINSIMKCRWEMADALIENGADTNIANERGYLPLQLLIKRRKFDLIKKIVKTLKTEDNGVNSDIVYANTDMLTEMEKKFLASIN